MQIATNWTFKDFFAAWNFHDSNRFYQRTCKYTKTSNSRHTQQMSHICFFIIWNWHSGELYQYKKLNICYLFNANLYIGHQNKFIDNDFWTILISKLSTVGRKSYIEAIKKFVAVHQNLININALKDK